MASGFPDVRPLVVAPNVRLAIEEIGKAFRRVRENEAIIIEQREFPKAYQRTAQALSDAEKAQVNRAIRQAAARYYKSTQENHPFRDWIKINNLEHDILFSETTQEGRYKYITRRLAAEEQRKRDVQDVYIGQADEFELRCRQEAGMELAIKHEPALRRIRETKKNIKKRAKLEEAANTVQNGLSLTNPSDPSPVSVAPFVTMNLLSNPAQQPVDVRIYGVRHTTYYCGFPSGSCIFRWNDPKDEEWQDWVSWPSSSESGDPGEPGEWKGVDASQQLLASVPDNDPRNFVFCGHVPRHAKEHLARLTILTGRVMRLIIAILAYADRRGTIPPRVSLDKAIKLGHKITGEDLNTVIWYWNHHFPKNAANDALSEEIKHVARRCPAVSEFTDLLSAMGPILGPAHELLVIQALLVRATGWSVEEMVDVEHKRKEDMATRAVFENHDTTNVFFFHDNTEKPVSVDPVPKVSISSGAP